MMSVHVIFYMFLISSDVLGQSVIDEIKKLKHHALLEDQRHNETKTLLMEIKQSIKDLLNDNAQTKDSIKEIKIQNAQTKEVIKEIQIQNAHLRRDIDEMKTMRKEVTMIKDVLTTPLAGKTSDKPSESCEWLSERHFNLPDGGYWLKENGGSEYGHCTMDKAGIPPVKCSSNPCHRDAACEDRERLDAKCTCHCGFIGDGKQCRKSFKPSKNNTGLLLIKDACAMKKGSQITTFKHMGPTYKVKFEVYPTQFEYSAFYNILHFTIGNDNTNFGDRMPAAWFDGYKPNQLHLTSGVNDEVNHIKDDSDTNIPLKQWSSVEIAQQQFDEPDYIYTIKLNDQEIHRVKNGKPRHFTGMRLYLSDPWYAAQKGYVRNLYLEGYEGYE